MHNVSLRIREDLGPSLLHACRLNSPCITIEKRGTTRVKTWKWERLIAAVDECCYTVVIINSNNLYGAESDSHHTIQSTRAHTINCSYKHPLVTKTHGLYQIAHYNVLTKWAKHTLRKRRRYRWIWREMRWFTDKCCLPSMLCAVVDECCW